jgi:DNA repair protein RadC
MEELHAGHRDRLRKRFLRAGLDTFEDHLVLELLLFYAVVRKDTNPVAHRLLDKFGSLAAVFDAPYDVLCKFEGVGEVVGTLLCMIPALSRRYQTDNHCKDAVYDTVESIGKFLVPQFVGRNSETVIALFFNKNRKLLHTEINCEGGPDAASINIRKIVSAVVKTNATSVVLSHNHVQGRVSPSEHDYEATEKTAIALGQISVDLIDHIIVSGTEYYSMRNQKSGFVE